MNGIIVIDKENGYTSFDVVAKMRRICGEKKIGHNLYYGRYHPGSYNYRKMYNVYFQNLH